MKKIIFALLLLVHSASAQIIIPEGYKLTRSTDQSVVRISNGTITVSITAIGRSILAEDSIQANHEAIDMVFGALPYSTKDHVLRNDQPIYNNGKFEFGIYANWSLFGIQVSSPRNDKEYKNMCSYIIKQANLHPRDIFFKGR